RSSAGARKGLTVNLEGAAGKAGAFAVEVLDAATRKPIQGFAAAECLAPKSDGLAAPVAWKAGPPLPAGGDIRLRFHLRARGVRLYSFGFRNSYRPRTSPLPAGPPSSYSPCSAQGGH